MTCFAMDTSAELSRLYRRVDRLGDKLANMEMQNGENPPADWQQRYAALEAEIAACEEHIALLGG